MHMFVCTWVHVCLCVHMGVHVWVCVGLHVSVCPCGHKCVCVCVRARLGQPCCLCRPREAEHTWLQLQLCCPHRVADSERQH